MKAWCIPKPSAQFAAKMEDVLAVYQRPHDAKRPLVCLDELRKELRTTPRGSLPIAVGQTVCEDYEYARHGACNLFLAVEPLAGRRYVWTTERRTKLDFAQVLRHLVDECYPEAERIVLVTDNCQERHRESTDRRFKMSPDQRLTCLLTCLL